MFLYELFTSKQFAASVLRQALWGLLLRVGGMVLLCEVALHLPLVYDIPGVPTPDISDPILHLAFIGSVLGFLTVIGLMAFFARIILKNAARRHVFARRTFYEDSTFFGETIALKQDKTISEDLRFYPTNLKLGDVHERALGYYGSTLGGELLIAVTVYVEYIFNIIAKVSQIPSICGYTNNHELR